MQDCTPRIEQRLEQVWCKMLAGGGWTALTCLLIGAVAAAFFAGTIFQQPREEVWRQSLRVHLAVEFWLDYGLLKYGGLNFSAPPERNPAALVYKSRPPAFMYPVYWANWVNSRLTDEKINLTFYVIYNQALLWLAASSFGFLGVRMARRLAIPPFFAFLCGVTGLFIFYTFPYHLEKYFEPFPEQIACILLIWLLLVEDAAYGKRAQRFQMLRACCVIGMVYFDKATAIPGLAAYLLAFMILGEASRATLAVVMSGAVIGVAAHAIQLYVVKLCYPQIVLAGSTFLWRSGLDGATNYAKMLTFHELGGGNDFLKYTSLGAFVILAGFFLWSDRAALKPAMLLLALAIGFYVMPSFFLIQHTLIHQALRDLFLPVVAVMAACYTLVPLLEKKTGQSGLFIWLMVIVGFCFCMYQLRFFAIAHPLPIPEPDWRAWRYLG